MAATKAFSMKINIANPRLGQQKTLEIEDEHKLLSYYEKRMGSEVEGDVLGDEYKGYIFRISGGNDRQGFPMMQGVLRNQRVRLLFAKGMPCYRERRNGMRKRKSVRGCIVGHDLAILNLVLVKEGDQPVAGLTDGKPERRLGPKRATKIRKLYDLTKDDDLKKFVVRRNIETGEGEEKTVKKTKAPKIQRLVTPVTLQRKRHIKNSMVKKIKENRESKAAYAKVLHNYKIVQKEKRAAELARKKAGKKKKTTTA
jgi:small subunit ribosomal protein S6e